jgi:ABC-2 type transport system permease protein
VGRRAGAAVQLSHHKAMGRANWGKVRDSLALLERANAAHDVLADQYPYTAGSTTLLALLPGWAVAAANVLPFKYTFGYPIEVLAGDLTTRELLTGLAAQAGWIAAGALLVAAVWRVGVRRYAAVGG